MSECVKCGSREIVPRARIMDRGHGSGDAGDLMAVTYEEPEALFFKGKKKSAIYAKVCAGCGFAELYVDSPRELYEAYRMGAERSGSSG